MPTLSYPNSFSAGTTIYSAEVNANFNAVSTLLNSTLLASDNIQTGGISTANLATNAVTTVKITDANVTAAKLASDSVTTAKILDANVTYAKVASDLLAFLVPTAAVLPYAGTSAPSGFLLCDGTAVSRSTYSTLFGVIGVTHGQGNGTTTFNIPDYRGRFMRGRDGGAGNDPDAASRTAMATGGNTGDNVGSIQGDAYAAHTHSISVANGDTGATPAGTSNGATTTSYSSGSSGSGTETRPKNAYVNYIIKT